jgi:superfamily II DNA or RNA helicase
MKVLRKEEIAKPETVYDLTVDDTHNYVVAGGAVVSNCHGIKAAVASKLINEHGRHIAFRFGVTGTFPKPEADALSLKSSIGEILIEIPASWLIEREYLSKVEIFPVELNEVFIDEEFPDYASEKAFLGKSPSRMETIANIIISQAAVYGNTLVLVNSIKFGERLSSLIKNSVFLYGESPKDLRKEHYDMFEHQDDIILIASSGIASTGISIDRVFCLMLVDAAKSFIKAIQSVGRGLRRGHDKTEVRVVDVHSKLKWAKKHFKERVKYYKEAGYPVAKTQTIKVKE